METLRRAVSMWPSTTSCRHLRMGSSLKAAYLPVILPAFTHRGALALDDDGLATLCSLLLLAHLGLGLEAAHVLESDELVAVPHQAERARSDELGGLTSRGARGPGAAEESNEEQRGGGYTVHEGPPLGLLPELQAFVIDRDRDLLPCRRLRRRRLG